MKVVYGCIIVAALLASGCRREAEDDWSWRTISSDDKSITVAMPGKPKGDNRNIEISQGTINVHLKELVTEHVAYKAGYFKYPDGLLISDAEAIFDRSRDSVVNERNATIVEEYKCNATDYPGKTIILQYSNPGNAAVITMRQDMILARGCMYLVESILAPDAPPAEIENVDRFHKSLVLNVK